MSMIPPLSQVKARGIQALYQLLHQGLLSQLYLPEVRLSFPHKSDVQFDVMGLSPVVTLGVIERDTFAIPVRCGMIVIL